MTTLALTDHDAVAGVPEAAKRRRERLGVELVPAIEMSCVHEYAEDLHICGYWVDLEKIAPACERAQQERRDRAGEIVENLRREGFDLTLDDAIREAGAADSIGRPHIARAAGATGDLGPFFEEYLVPGAKAFVPRRWPTAAQAIELIREAGGVAVDRPPLLGHLRPGRGRGPDPLARRRRGRDLLPAPHQGADRAPAGALRGARPGPHRLLRLPRPDPQDLRQVRRLRHLRARPARCRPSLSRAPVGPAYAGAGRRRTGASTWYDTADGRRAVGWTARPRRGRLV